MLDLNGTGRSPGAAVLGARRRVSAVPKTVEFDVETVADGVVRMVGYCKGPSCPVTVTIEAEAAYDVWVAATYLPATDEERSAWDAHVAACAERSDEPGPCPIDVDGTVRHFNHAAELTYRRDLLVAVFPEVRGIHPGISPETASVLAADGGPWLEMLRELGYWAPAAEAIADPEVAGEDADASPPIGEASSPTSASATAPTTGSA